MLHYISDKDLKATEGFTNPFRYHPHPLVQKAAAEVMDRLEHWKKLPASSPLRAIEQSFAEGKMLGVLICRKKHSDFLPKNEPDLHGLCYISAFSGTVRNASGKATATVEGFVPPIIDLTCPDGYFKIKEEEISQINLKISELSSSPHLSGLKSRLKDAVQLMDREIEQMQAQMSISKTRRDEIRSETSDPNTYSSLIKESQHQKAQLKRLKDQWKKNICTIEEEIAKVENEIKALKSLRASKSDTLQKWIFENALVHDSTGDCKSIWDIFAQEGLTPPGGTGDCAAPKLLEYAYQNILTPLAMGEFWYGLSPETAVRTHGHFYPSCTSKCGPLLGFMMKGLGVEASSSVEQASVVIHEDDDIIVVEKPSGMPSVPGLDGKISLQEHLSAPSGISVHAVHRLDMDTSGVMVFAKTKQAAVNLRKQFEEHSVSKTYMARISPCLQTGPQVKTDRLIETDQLVKKDQFVKKDQLVKTDEEPISSGEIALPLSPDYDERPRQKVDFKQGKPAHTKYQVIRNNPDGTTDLLLHPVTGRTHQLRVHCAHHLGLCRPILGDLLYGSSSASPGISDASIVATAASRLCLHALSITFRHPSTDQSVTFTSEFTSYK